MKIHLTEFDEEFGAIVACGKWVPASHATTDTERVTCRACWVTRAFLRMNGGRRG